MREREPGQVRRVAVHGHEVVTYSSGEGEDVLLLINSGPGMPCDYIRDSHSLLADRGFRVVACDQLGCGASDRPDDPGLLAGEIFCVICEADHIQLQHLVE